jgi:hypothetical protein
LEADICVCGNIQRPKLVLPSALAGASYQTGFFYLGVDNSGDAAHILDLGLVNL